MCNVFSIYIAIRESFIATLADILQIPDWYKDANCIGTDQDEFFPERGSSKNHEA